MRTLFQRRSRRNDESDALDDDQRSTIAGDRPAAGEDATRAHDGHDDGHPPSHSVASPRDDPSRSGVATSDPDTQVDREHARNDVDGETRQTGTVAARDHDTRTIVPESHPEASGGRALLRAPKLAPLAAIGGWAAAWGIAVVAIACLAAAGIATGQGFGIADGGPNVADGVGAGFWLAVALAGGFVGGGYVAARMARTAPIAHGVTAWLFALLATAADGLVADPRDSASVLDAIGLPSWEGNTYSGIELAVPLIMFAAVSLVGVLIGSALGAAANRRERSPMRQI